MAFRPTSIDDLEMRRRWNWADDDPGPISLPKMLLPKGQARRLDEARWAEPSASQGNAEIGGAHGWDMIAGGTGGDRLLPEHDANARWSEGAADGPADPARLPYDFASLAGADPGPTYSDPRMKPDIDRVLADRTSISANDDGGPRPALRIFRG